MILSNFKMTDAEIIARAERRHGKPMKKDHFPICAQAQEDGAEECVCPDQQSFDEDVKMSKRELRMGL